MDNGGLRARVCEPIIHLFSEAVHLGFGQRPDGEGLGVVVSEPDFGSTEHPLRVEAVWQRGKRRLPQFSQT